jgi:caffeoyl-CoA O-methyltransferase
MNLVAPAIEAYCYQESSLPSPICQEIEAFTKSQVASPQMLSGPLVGSFLGLLVGVTGAKRVLEIGTFTGYSALAMAERLGTGGELITLDKNSETQTLARGFWYKSPHGNKIQALNGNASELLGELTGLFDLVFIDADKAGYLGYLKSALSKLSPRGVIVADNCLWSGRVLDLETSDLDTLALQQFNDYVASSKELENTLLPVRDGLNVIRKRTS